MKLVLVVIGDGRGEYLEQAVPAALPLTTTSNRRVKVPEAGAGTSVPFVCPAVNIVPKKRS